MQLRDAIKGIMVTLTPQEVKDAREVGTTRHNESVKNKNQERLQNPNKTSLETDQDGAEYELAVCKGLTIPWSKSVNTFGAPDMLHDGQIKGTEYRSGCLIVRERNNPEHRYILVIDHGQWRDGLFHYYIAGWIYGKDARKDEWKKNPNDREPAWFVPQDALNPVREFTIET